MGEAQELRAAAAMASWHSTAEHRRNAWHAVATDASEAWADNRGWDTRHVSAQTNMYDDKESLNGRGKGSNRANNSNSVAEHGGSKDWKCDDATYSRPWKKASGGFKESTELVRGKEAPKGDKDLEAVDTAAWESC